MRKFLKKSAGLSVINVLGTLVSLTLSLYVSRTFGSNTTGLYYSTLALITFGSLIISFGDTKILLKSVAISHKENNDSQSALTDCHQGFYIRAIIVMLLLYLTHVVLNLYKVEFNYNYIALTVAGLLLSQVQLIASYFNGLDRLYISSLLTSIALSACLLFTILLVHGTIIINNESISYWFLCSYAIAHTISATLAKVNIFTMNFDPYSFIPSKGSLKLTATLFLNYLATWSSTYIILLYATHDSVGIYNTSLRLTLLSSIVSTVVIAIFSPIFARENDKSILQKMTTLNARMCFIFGGLSLIPYFVYGEWFLSFFGDDFRAGNGALIALSASKLIALSFGTSGHLLIMKGEYTSLLICVLFGVFTQIVCGFLLIPSNPVTGAAIAVSLGTLIEEILKFFFVYKKTGLISFIYCTRR